ncbi:Tn3 family transposase [Streptomyces sp. NPDC059679]|uniref:Tn3 family transposase n=1 Tax=Streptomyces sp. NPDC059679 TaxID=3346903 RepID=UPI0036A44252
MATHPDPLPNPETVSSKSQAGRKDYSERFLGPAVPLPLPAGLGIETVILPYTNFSVVFRPDRRLAAATGVTIDGANLIEAPRDDDWRSDPRLPEAQQAGHPICKDNPLKQRTPGPPPRSHLRFWKVAAFMPNGDMASTAYVLDQSPDLTKAAAAQAMAKAARAGDPPPLGAFRTLVAELTGLDLGPLLAADQLPAMRAARRWTLLELTFYRPSKQSEYAHIDALFGQPGKHVIDFDLIESQFRHLMRVAVSVREGTISSSTLLKRLRSGSRKNATYAAFREVGRVIRTVQLLSYLSDAPLRRRVTAATNKVESFNRFSQWIGFGNRGVIADNDPIEQEKAMKFNALLTNAGLLRGSASNTVARAGDPIPLPWGRGL